MARRSHLEIVQLSLRVPRGIDGFWSIIRELQDGWTITDVANRTNVHKRNVSDFVQGLHAAGFAKIIGTTQCRDGLPPANCYRLLKRPLITPRLKRDGTEHPETAIETLWRTMKIAKTFTLAELVALASVEGAREINPANARRYLAHLVVAGIVARTPGKPGRDAQYNLVRNLGLRAPKVLATKVVFDPNANAVVGEAVAREAKP